MPGFGSDWVGSRGRLGTGWPGFGRPKKNLSQIMTNQAGIGWDFPDWVRLVLGRFSGTFGDGLD